MSNFSKWQVTPSLRFAKTPGDRTWWLKSVRGHKKHILAGLVLTEIYREERLMGEELHMVAGPIRIVLAMRFTHEALSAQREMRGEAE